MIIRYFIIVFVGSAILSLCAQQEDGGSAVANPQVMSLSEQELVRIWRAPNASVQQRESAVKRCFTNGTPISTIIGVLGTNFTAFSHFSVGTGQQIHSIVYSDKGVSIGSTGDVKTNLQGAFFTGTTGRIVSSRSVSDVIGTTNANELHWGEEVSGFQMAVSLDEATGILHCFMVLVFLCRDLAVCGSST